MSEHEHAGADRGRILEAITRLQSAVIAGEADMRAAFDRALGVLLEATDSQSGFIGQAQTQPGGAPCLQTLAITDTEQDAARALDRVARAHGFELRQAGAPAGDDGQDAPGDAPPDAAMALPLVYAGETVGLAGLANRTGGYHAPLVDDLAPLASALAAMIVAETAKAQRDRQAERAQLAVQGSDAAIWDWDIKTGTVWWSPSLKAMLGVDAAFEPDFDFFLQRVHPDDRATLTGALDATLNTDAPYRLTCRLARPDGGYATIRTSGHLVRAAHGAPERLVGVQIDISREIELEREAREAGALVEVAAAAGLASWRWDPERDTFHIDTRFSALLQRPDFAGRTLAGGDILALVHPDDRAMVAEELAEVRTRDRHVFRREHRALAPDGSVIWLRAHAGRAPDGTVIGVVEDRTAAKQAELETAAAKERFERAVDGSFLAVWDWDAANDTLFWSDRFLEILGLERSDFGGRFADFSTRVHPGDLPAVEAAIRAHVETGAPYDIEFRMRHRSGDWVTVQGRGAGTAGPDGALQRMSGSILDVTAEREAEQAAADAAMKISMAAGHAGIGAIEIDLAAAEMRGDACLSRLIGDPGRTTLSMREAADLVHPGDRSAMTVRLEKVLRGESDRFHCEHRIVRPDGSVAFAETVTMVTRRGEDGAPVFLSGVIIDHTDRRRTERELAAAKERYDLAVGAAQMAIWDQDLKTGEVYWSQRMGEILGLGAQERREHRETFAGRIHPDDRARMSEAFKALIEGAAPFDETCRLLHADGSYVPVRSRGGVVRDDAGAAVRVCGSLSDISAEVSARARADLAVSAAGLGLWEWDLAKGVMHADARFAAMLGRPWLAEQPGPVEQPLRFIHGEDLDAARAWMADLEAGRIQRVEFEHRAIRPDGSEVWLGGYANVTETGETGRPLRVLGVFEDRTARKRAEMEVAEAKLRYDVAVAGSYAAIWDQNLITNEIYWTARLGEILGLGAEARTEPLSVFLERTHPDDRAYARDMARAAIESGGPLDNVLRIRRSDGVYRHLRSRAGVLHDAEGRPVRLCGSITDITDELEAEARARLSGRRAELALQAAHLGVWEFDAETGEVTVDRTLAHLLDAPDIQERALTADEIQSFIHPEDIDQVRVDLAGLQSETLNSVGTEHRMVRRDGTSVWVRGDVGVAERNHDGTVKRLIGIVQDLSGVKLSEELLRRTAEQARQASAAKSQFLATMSHEIRTPLNGVLGVVQLLEFTELDARQRRYVETIKASGRSLAEVIEDVLDISRIEAGKLELKPEPSMVADILDQAIAPSRAVAAQKGLQLNMTVSGDLTDPVLVDPRRVAQMVANLIGNAVKFTDAGGVRVRAGRPDKAVMRIEVEDDGPGLPEEMHEAVFERFTQADMSQSRAHEGTGLGLAIVRELAQLAGGIVGVRSTPGCGATFWIEIPAPAAQRAAASDPARAQAAPGAMIRVLVVEDHPVNRAVTAELVTQAGHMCETADCGAEALRSLKNRPVDLILLDLHMPDMDGAETLARLRRGEAGAPDTPVFMVSADATPEARSKTLALGADGYLVKPIDADALRRILAQASDRKREAG